MRLFSYVVAYDIGFAPNPYHGYCTLATCKQDIRGRANVEDWIVGTGSARHRLADHLVYAMKIDEIVTYEQYWDDPRFRDKRPKTIGSFKQQYGDNIYHQNASGDWLQLDGRHSLDDGSPNEGHIARDTKADAVMISRHFCYFGGEGPLIPSAFRDNAELSLVHGGRAYRVNFPADMTAAVIAWIEDDLPKGIQGVPRDWRTLTRTIRRRENARARTA